MESHHNTVTDIDPSKWDELGVLQKRMLGEYLKSHPKVWHFEAYEQNNEGDNKPKVYTIIIDNVTYQLCLTHSILRRYRASQFPNRASLFASDEENKKEIRFEIMSKDHFAKGANK